MRAPARPISRLLTLPLALVMAVAGLTLVAAPASAATVTEKIGFTTYVGDTVTHQATITDYEHTVGNGNVTVPTQVTLSGEVYTVTEVGFHSYGAIDSVVIPEGIKTIGGAAFQGGHIQTLTIPNSVTSIGASAFANNELTSVNLGTGVTSLPFQTFAHNDFTTVSIPNTITTLGNEVFFNNELTSVNLGKSLTSIGSGAFKQAFSLPSNLHSVVVPKLVSSIGSLAFGDAATLSVRFLGPAPTITPASPTGTFGAARAGLTIEYLHDYAPGYATPWQGYTTQQAAPYVLNGIAYALHDFLGAATAVDYDGTTQGTTVVIPASVTFDGYTYDVTEVGEAAFKAKSLTSVTLPNSVTTLDFQAFLDNQITTLSLGTGLVTIGNGAFSENLLTTVSIPSSVPPSATTHSPPTSSPP